MKLDGSSTHPWRLFLDNGILALPLLQSQLRGADLLLKLQQIPLGLHPHLALPASAASGHAGGEQHKNTKNHAKKKKKKHTAPECTGVKTLGVLGVGGPLLLGGLLAEEEEERAGGGWGGVL